MNDGTHDERAREGLVHLQAAALELIAAARAFLDVAESITREPGAIAAVADAAASVVRAAAASAPSGKGPKADSGGQADEDPPPGVTRIRLS